MKNFGTMSKSEIDLLLFSEYLDRLFQMENVKENDYSDYTLSNVLGITQNRVRSLKERKEIKYPSEFDWKISFQKQVKKAELKDGKVKLFIPDIRLYIELCNITQELGSYTETTLTRQLLVVSLPTFVDLMIEASDNESSEMIKEKLKKILSDNRIEWEDFTNEEKTFRETLKNQKEDIVKKVLLSFAEQIPVIGSPLAVAAESIFEAYNQSAK